MERCKVMADDTVDLDEYRGLTALRMIDIRRQRLHDFDTDPEDSSCRNEKIAKLLAEGPSETWSMAAAKAAYLLRLFAAIPDGPESKRSELIFQTLDDLNRLSNFEREI